MLKVNIDAIDEKFLNQLCEDKCPESSTLDFKRQFPGTLEQDRIEIAKDICAMANADGGFIIYGIDEKDGGAFEVTPMVGESSDSDLRRISQLLESGIEPRVPGVRTAAISLQKGYAIVVQVDSSYDGPHCVRSKSNRRFVMRNGTMTTDMTFDQIRMAFNRTTTLVEKARIFAEQRCDMIEQDRGALKFMPGAILAVHFMPLVALGGRAKIDVSTIHNSGYEDFADIDSGGLTRSLNLDGLLIHHGNDPAYSYRFIFRDGCMEAAQHVGEVKDYGSGSDTGILWPKEIACELRHITQQFLEAARRFDLPGSAILQCSLVSAKDFRLGTGGNWREVSKVGDRARYNFPPEWIDSVQVAEVDKIITPILHTLWQSFGQRRCPYIDSTTGDFNVPK